MLEFQQKRRLRRIFYSRVTLFILFGGLLWFGQGTFSLWQKKQGAAREMAGLEKELAALEAKERSLTSRIAALKTQRGIEEAIREKFKVAKEGEGVVVVVDPKQKTDTIGNANPLSEWWKTLGEFLKF